MKQRRRPKASPQPDRWAAFDSRPASVRHALSRAAYPLDPLKLIGLGDAETALRRLARLEAAARRRGRCE